MSAESRYILGMRVDATDYAEASARILAWATQPVSRTVCCANAHMVMEGHDRPEFREIVNSADLVTADGMPLVWALHLAGAAGASRVYGPDLTSAVLARAAAAGVPVGFYGATRATVERLRAACRAAHPGLRIAYAFAPPFRGLTREEDERITAEIRASGARILFVGLGCPKQELWMAQHKASLSAVLLGVGAAFDLLAGVKPRAPRWMQRAGCEWLFRLAVEPSRLWRRYLSSNPRFAWLLLREWMRPGVHIARRVGQ
jgi:N-acetylglucosaminyldiphosphoundecaprenol N-acetyl-beta-D-mannosaminyltransferase